MQPLQLQKASKQSKPHDGVLVHIFMLAHTWTTTMLFRYVDLVHNNHREGCMGKHVPSPPRRQQVCYFTITTQTILHDEANDVKKCTARKPL